MKWAFARRKYQLNPRSASRRNAPKSAFLAGGQGIFCQWRRRNTHTSRIDTDLVREAAFKKVQNGL